MMGREEAKVRGRSYLALEIVDNRLIMQKHHHHNSTTDKKQRTAADSPTPTHCFPSTTLSLSTHVRLPAANCQKAPPRTTLSSHQLN